MIKRTSKYVWARISSKNHVVLHAIAEWIFESPRVIIVRRWAGGARLRGSDSSWVRRKKLIISRQILLAFLPQRMFTVRIVTSHWIQMKIGLRVRWLYQPLITLLDMFRQIHFDLVVLHLFRLRRCLLADIVLNARWQRLMIVALLLLFLRRFLLKLMLQERVDDVISGSLYFLRWVKQLLRWTISLISHCLN